MSGSSSCTNLRAMAAGAIMEGEEDLVVVVG